jgi:hypothetical protein
MWLVAEADLAIMSAVVSALTPGQRLGPYEVESSIGAGGMGEVYQARDTRLNRTVAIKVSREQFSERFEREAFAIAALNHPNICTVYDVGPNYLVMELVEGPTLAERMASGAILLEESLRIARQIGDALEAAHEQGIVHRDLKPRQRKDHAWRPRKGAGFRTGEGRRHSGGPKLRELSDHQHGRDAGRRDPGNGGVHGPGAGSRQARG